MVRVSVCQPLESDPRTHPVGHRHDGGHALSAAVPLEPLPPLFHRLNREHFEGSLSLDGRPLVALRWSDGRLTRTAGLYRRGLHRDGSDLCEIVLSRPLLEPLPRSATLSTLCHEMIHAWVDRVLEVREVHGPRFRARMEAINRAQNDFEVSLRHRFPVPRPGEPLDRPLPPLRPACLLPAATPGSGLQNLLRTVPRRPLGCQLSAGVRARPWPERYGRRLACPAGALLRGNGRCPHFSGPWSGRG